MTPPKRELLKTGNMMEKLYLYGRSNARPYVSISDFFKVAMAAISKMAAF